MKKTLTILVLMALCLSLPPTALAQVNPDSTYASYVALYQLLKNGRQYGHSYKLTEGKQFRSEKSIRTGGIVYEGVSYPDLQLNYDVYNDLVFVSLFIGERQSYVILNPQKLTAFTLESEHYLNLPAKTYANLPAGIYERLSSDETVLVRRHKDLIKDLDNYTQKQYRFETKDTYYLIYQGQAWPVRNKKDVIAALGESPELLSLLKQYKLKLKRNSFAFEQGLVKAMDLAKNP